MIADFIEERWPSMDLCAEQLTRHLGDLPNVEGRLVRPPLRFVRAGQIPGGLARGLGRFVQLPVELTSARPKVDYFHIADHSYAHLALLFPKQRVGVYCHDVDAFRATLPGSDAPYSRVLLSRLLLKGLRHARVVFHNTRAVREEILRYGLVPASRLVHARLGAAEEFLRVTSVAPAAPPYLMHVGSCIPRKNVDFLVKLFAVLAQQHPELRLLQVGGQWSANQRQVLDRHLLSARVEQRTNLSRTELAELYAAAAVVLVPSLSEGFGLPVIESVACGTPVVATDIAVLREVGIEGAHFCAPSKTEDWVATVNQLLASRERVSTIGRQRIVSNYSWRAHATTVIEAYTREPIIR